MLVDVRFVASACLEALQICMTVQSCCSSHCRARSLSCAWTFSDPDAWRDLSFALSVYLKHLETLCEAQVSPSTRTRERPGAAEASCAIVTVLEQDYTVMQIWSASRHALATNRTSISISGSARIHQAQQLQVLSTNWLCSSRFERFQGV